MDNMNYGQGHPYKVEYDVYGRLYRYEYLVTLEYMRRELFAELYDSCLDTQYFGDLLGQFLERISFLMTQEYVLENAVNVRVVEYGGKNEVYIYITDRPIRKFLYEFVAAIMSGINVDVLAEEFLGVY